MFRQHGASFGLSRPVEFFWLTGLLSSLLDNAPTYMTFATLAAGEHDLAWLSVHQGRLFSAISCGAVFIGAATYIGNGPNFMVKAIAEERGFPMPSFGKYIIYSLLVLVPVYALATWVFFV